MFNKFTHLGLMCLSLVLSGCKPTPWVIEEYDELTKSKVCKLNNYLIRNEFGMTSSRQTHLTLEKRADQKIKAILTSGSNIGLTSYDSFSANSKVRFKLSGPNQKSEEIVFQGEIPGTTYGTQPLYVAQGLILPMPNKSSSIIFYLTKEQLIDIINSPQVEYAVEAGENPLTGKISEPIKNLIRTFLEKCCQSTLAT